MSGFNTTTVVFGPVSYAANSPAGSAIQSIVLANLHNGIAQGIITVQGGFNSSAISGMTIALLSSPDGTNWDSSVSPYAASSMTFTANAYIQKSFLVNPLPKYLSVNLFNVDSAYAVNSVRVWITQIWNE